MNVALITNGNLAALISGIVPPADKVATGEPCACPEHADCLCGAFVDAYTVRYSIRHQGWIVVDADGHCARGAYQTEAGAEGARDELLAEFDDEFVDCEGHTSTIGSVEPYTEYCAGRCRRA